MEPQDFKTKLAKLHDIWAGIQAEHLAKPGWSLLEDEGRVWGEFNKMYKFRPSTQEEDWPGIAEPQPSRTYNIGHIYGPDFNRLTYELSTFYMSCFTRIIPDNQSVTVLDWQHPCYAFDPHAGFKFEAMEDWPVTPLPNGDYYIFLTDDLRAGFFGHPWEQTICVIGKAFIDHLDNAPPGVFSDLIRVDGAAV